MKKMNRALLAGGFLGAIIVFIWMMISWMVLPWHCASLQKVTSEQQVAQTILTNTNKDGVYVLPNVCGIKDSKVRAQAMQNSPVVFISVQREGFDTTSVRPYIVSFIIQLIGAFLITYLLLLTRGLVYWHRVIFVTLVGVIVAVLGVLPDCNWWGFSMEYTFTQFADYVIGWFLAGLAIAGVAKV